MQEEEEESELPSSIDALVSSFLQGTLPLLPPSSARAGHQQQQQVAPEAVQRPLQLSVLVSERLLQDGALYEQLQQRARLALYEQDLPLPMDVALDDATACAILPLRTMITTTVVTHAAAASRPPGCVRGGGPSAPGVRVAVAVEEAGGQEVYKTWARALARQARKYGRVYVLVDGRGCDGGAGGGPGGEAWRTAAAAAALLEEGGGEQQPAAPVRLHPVAVDVLRKLQATTLNFPIPVTWHVACSAGSMAALVRACVEGRAGGVARAVQGGREAGVQLTRLRALRSWAYRPWLSTIECAQEVSLTALGLNPYTAARLAGHYDTAGRLLTAVGDVQALQAAVGPSFPAHVLHCVHALGTAAVEGGRTTLLGAIEQRRVHGGDQGQGQEEAGGAQYDGSGQAHMHPGPPPAFSVARMMATQREREREQLEQREPQQQQQGYATAECNDASPHRMPGTPMGQAVWGHSVRAGPWEPHTLPKTSAATDYTPSTSAPVRFKLQEEEEGDKGVPLFRTRAYGGPSSQVPYWPAEEPQAMMGVPMPSMAPPPPPVPLYAPPWATRLPVSGAQQPAWQQAALAGHGAMMVSMGLQARGAQMQEPASHGYFYASHGAGHGHGPAARPPTARFLGQRLR